jgi:hypothetical protein
MPNPKSLCQANVAAAKADRTSLLAGKKLKLQSVCPNYECLDQPVRPLKNFTLCELRTVLASGICRFGNAKAYLLQHKAWKKSLHITGFT